jgi:hypothetical protein
MDPVSIAVLLPPEIFQMSLLVFGAVTTERAPESALH